MPRRRLPSAWLTRCGGISDGQYLPCLDLIWGIIAIPPWHERVYASQMCPSWLVRTGMRSMRQRSGYRRQAVCQLNGCQLAGKERQRCSCAAVCAHDAGGAAPGRRRRGRHSPRHPQRDAREWHPGGPQTGEPLPALYPSPAHRAALANTASVVAALFTTPTRSSQQLWDHHHHCRPAPGRGLRGYVWRL